MSIQFLQQCAKEITEKQQSPLYRMLFPVQPEEFNTSALRDNIQDLIDTLSDAGGVGIAANQIGLRKQIFIIEADFSKVTRYKGHANIPRQIFINPRITAVSSALVDFWHGCLSVKEAKRGRVACYEWLEYEAYDPLGNKRNGRLDDMSAIVFQHEFNHLLGRLYIDRTDILLSIDELMQNHGGDLPTILEHEAKVPLLLGEEYIIGESLESYYSRNYVYV